MRLSRLRLAAVLRSRAAAAVAVAAVLVVVVASNQPHQGAISHPRAATATSTIPDDPHQGPPSMRLLKRRVAFHDDTAAHPGAPQVAADSGILVDLDPKGGGILEADAGRILEPNVGSILWERNPHLVRAPASTTKLVSSLVALENFPPDQQVTVTADALHQQWDETVMGIHAGQRYTVAELLTGMLLVSGNDAATAMAVDTVGLDRFVAAMNDQVAALGLHDSHFTTPVGLDDPAQRSSAHDLAAVAAVDVETFPLLRQLVATTDEQLPAGERHPAFSLHNLNRLLSTYPGAVGVKPGYTGDAGPCLVGEAVRGGHRLLGVLLGAPRVYTDMRALLDWGFTQEGMSPLLTPPPTPTAARSRAAAHRP
jgi:serine-type D-Ala-D-Ala carboxypeptidase (penicillin-binding protein 5/6)